MKRYGRYGLNSMINVLLVISILMFTSMNTAGCNKTDKSILETESIVDGEETESVIFAVDFAAVNVGFITNANEAEVYEADILMAMSNCGMAPNQLFTENSPIEEAVGLLAEKQCRIII